MTKLGKDQKRFNRLLKGLTPAAKLHQKYLADVNFFLHKYEILSRSLKKPPPPKFELKKSILFQREYLVGHVDTKWFGDKAIFCNAAATDSLCVAGLNSPPLVLIPKSKDSIEKSILEHEFVHVNQAILHKFPDSFGRSSIQQVRNIFLAKIKAEYEANFLQASRWPECIPNDLRFDYSIDAWCALRSITQAIESVIQQSGEGKLKPSTVISAMEKISPAVMKCLREYGATESDVVLQVSNIYEYFNQASSILYRALPPQTHKPILQIWTWAMYVTGNLNQEEVKKTRATLQRWS